MKHNATKLLVAATLASLSAAEAETGEEVIALDETVIEGQTSTPTRSTR